MKLDIIAQIVQILKDAPEVGAIEIRRGLFGAWSSVRVSKAGHGSNTVGEGHVIVSHSPAASSPSPTSAVAAISDSSWRKTSCSSFTSIRKEAGFCRH